MCTCSNCKRCLMNNSTHEKLYSSPFQNTTKDQNTIALEEIMSNGITIQEITHTHSLNQHCKLRVRRGKADYAVQSGSLATRRGHCSSRQRPQNISIQTDRSAFSAPISLSNLSCSTQSRKSATFGFHLALLIDPIKA